MVFGDSTTAKRGELKIYAGILQQELPRKSLSVRVVNGGVGGNNTQHARARFEKDVLDQSPGIVVIQFGSNDAAVDVWKDPPATKSRVSIENYGENLRHFVRTLKASQDAGHSDDSQSAAMDAEDARTVWQAALPSE